MAHIVTVDQMRPANGTVALAASVLAGGGVVVMPTDSVYGIGCAATPQNPAHERIFSIKRRDRAQTLPWLVCDATALETYATDVPSWAHVLVEELWPGALTLVVRASTAVPPEYVATDGTIALRVPASPLVCALANAVGPLAVTSANTHGAAAATSGAAVERPIAAAADLVLDAGPAPVGVASTIVAAVGSVDGGATGTAATAPRILREGAIAAATVQQLSFPHCGRLRDDDGLEVR